MQTIEANMRVVLGPQASDAQVQRTARAILQHAGHVYFDLYKALSIGPEAIFANVRSTPLTDYYLDEITRQKRGALMVGPHVSNFDLGALYVSYRGHKMSARWASRCRPAVIICRTRCGWLAASTSCLSTCQRCARRWAC